jgi:MFS family permease
MENNRLKKLPRNIWAVSFTSFFMDISSEMVLNILPLFLANVLGVKTDIIGVIEGTAEATASIMKVFSGWISDRLGSRKWIAVLGYGISAISKPFFYFADSSLVVGVVRWADRVGKGVRTAPRDALVANSIKTRQRGIAFGFHRAADTAGAMFGLLIALAVVWIMQSNNVSLNRGTFQTIVLISLLPAGLAVASLAIGAREVAAEGKVERPKITFRSLGKPFLIFMVISAIFDIGNSSDAFLVLRAQNVGVSVLGILGMLAVFNFVYAVVSYPAGSLSDRIDRRILLIAGWLVYAAIYAGFAAAGANWQVWILYVVYGLYYGLTYGTIKAFIADLIPAHLRGTAYGTHNAVLGVLDLPASVIAGVLWQGAGSFGGFGPRAPFIFGAIMALIAVLLMVLWMPRIKPESEKSA